MPTAREADRAPPWLASVGMLTGLLGCAGTRQLGGGLAIARDEPNPETTRLTWVSAVGEGALRWNGGLGVHSSLRLATVSGAETRGAAIEALAGPLLQRCGASGELCFELRGAVGGNLSDYGYGPDSTTRLALITDALGGLRGRVRTRDELGVRVLLGYRWKWIEDHDGLRPTAGPSFMVLLDRTWR